MFQQDLLPILESLPASSRREAADLLGSILPLFYEQIRSGLQSVEMTQRMAVLRSVVGSLTRIPPSWIPIARSLLAAAPSLDSAADTLRRFVGALFALAPDWYAQAMGELLQLSPGGWIERLGQLSLQHPRLVGLPEGLPASYSSFTGPAVVSQQIPPPPAQQNVCIVNEFVPSWGTPPATYKAVAMRFDPAFGAYEFDMKYALANSPRDRLGNPSYTLSDLDWLDRTYRGTFMVQPYRRGDDPKAWNFRTIVRARSVKCG